LTFIVTEGLESSPELCHLESAHHRPQEPVINAQKDAKSGRRQLSIVTWSATELPYHVYSAVDNDYVIQIPGIASDTRSGTKTDFYTLRGQTYYN